MSIAQQADGSYTVTAPIITRKSRTFSCKTHREAVYLQCKLIAIHKFIVARDHDHVDDLDEITNKYDKYFQMLLDYYNGYLYKDDELVVYFIRLAMCNNDAIEYAKLFEKGRHIAGGACTTLSLTTKLVPEGRTESLPILFAAMHVLDVAINYKSRQRFVNSEAAERREDLRGMLREYVCADFTDIIMRYIDWV